MTKLRLSASRRRQAAGGASRRRTSVWPLIGVLLAAFAGVVVIGGYACTFKQRGNAVTAAPERQSAVDHPAPDVQVENRKTPEPETPVGSFLPCLLGTKGGVVVAFGSTDASRAAAVVLRDAIRRIPGHSDWDGILPAAEFDAKDFAVTGQTHVIAVGTLWDNEVLRGRSWLPTWWMDFDWYQNKYEFALSPADMGLPYQYKTGFMAAGFGAWPKGQTGVGLVEVDRSHLFMEWMVRSRLDRLTTDKQRKDPRQNYYRQMQALKDVRTPTYPTDVPLRLLVRVTGSGPAGVLAAARAFAERGMLNGVVLTAGAAASAAPEMFALTGSRYRKQLPFEPPAGSNGYTYMGWLLPSAFQYDGFAFETEIRPKQMWRLKYRPDFGITNFWTTPHRRASQFEIVILEFADVAEAKTAAAAVMKSLKTRNGAKKNRITGLNQTRRGNVVFVESLPEPAGKDLLARCVAAWKEAGK